MTLHHIAYIICTYNIRAYVRIYIPIYTYIYIYDVGRAMNRVAALAEVGEKRFKLETHVSHTVHSSCLVCAEIPWPFR